MSQYYISHAGMLQYLSREFRAAAKLEPDSGRFFTYASVLDRIADDLMYGEEDEPSDGIPPPLAEIK